MDDEVLTIHESWPGTTIDGSMRVMCGVPTTFFNGMVPPNGFMIQSSVLQTVMVNDNGLATLSPRSGFLAPWAAGNNGNIFITPPGYKPMGPVSVFLDCNSDPPSKEPFYLAARAW